MSDAADVAANDQMKAEAIDLLRGSDAWFLITLRAGEDPLVSWTSPSSLDPDQGVRLVDAVRRAVGPVDG